MIVSDSASEGTRADECGDIIAQMLGEIESEIDEREIVPDERDEIEDTNEWVRRLAPSRSVLDFWPGRATPVHLEQLSSAPASAWEGGLGAARRLLRLLVARRLSAGQFEEMVIEGGEFAAEFEVADNVEEELSSGSVFDTLELDDAREGGA